MKIKDCIEGSRVKVYTDSNGEIINNPSFSTIEADIVYFSKFDCCVAWKNNETKPNHWIISPGMIQTSGRIDAYLLGYRYGWWINLNAEIAGCISSGTIVGVDMGHSQSLSIKKFNGMNCAVCHEYNEYMEQPNCKDGKYRCYQHKGRLAL